MIFRLRPRCRRLLFLATLVVAIILVFEVLVLPVIQFARQQEDSRVELPSNLAKPTIEDPTIKSPSLAEQLLKEHNRSTKIPTQLRHRNDLILEQLQEDQNNSEEIQDIGENITVIIEYDEVNQGLLEEVGPFYSPITNSSKHTVSSTQPDSVSKEESTTKKETKASTKSGGAHATKINEQLRTTDEKYWFFKNGTVWPTKGKDAHSAKRKIWPHEDTSSDRIVDQLMYIPENYDPSHVRKVVLANNRGAWNVPMGAYVFQKCPVNACTLISDIETADAVMFRDFVNLKSELKTASQKWILYILESPTYTAISSQNRSFIDMTATYRMDSDIVAPYEKWVYYNERVKTLEANRLVNFAAEKTAQVAWFVSNCHATNQRLEYAKDLQRYISVDIYGACGSLSCPRHDSSHCYNLLNTKYKFYLSFENSNCKDYITEKFFVTGLGNNILPIVMGAEKSHYVRSAPHNSYIHVDDFDSPKQLAEYLLLLDKNDTLYNEYFQWKGTGELINTYFWCRLCMMLHDSGSGNSGMYADIGRWWHENTCREKSWRLEDTKELADDL